MIKRFSEFIEEGMWGSALRRSNTGERRLEDLDYVDLGLPSGLLWCKYNLGGENESDNGSYFAWGEIESKDEYLADTYKYYDMSGDGDDYIVGLKYTSDSGDILDKSDDAAVMNLGKGYRVPTVKECEELIKNTDCTLETNYMGVGICGLILTSKHNGNELFIPFNGYMLGEHLYQLGYQVYLWTAESPEYASDFISAYALTSEFRRNMFKIDEHLRHRGFGIRPVKDKVNK